MNIRPLLFACCMAGGWSLAGWQQIPAIEQLLQGTEPQASELTLNLPVFVEDGAAVPVSIQGPGWSGAEPEDWLTRLLLFADGNPNAEVLEWQLHQPQASLDLHSRIRIDQSQSLWLLSQSQTGEWFVQQAAIEVLASGCLVPLDSLDTQGMTNPRVISRAIDGAPGQYQVRTLINHPMDTGLRQGPDGELVPRRIVEQLSLSLNGEPLMDVRLHGAVSANPFLQMQITGSSQDELALLWQTSDGQSLEFSQTLP